MRLSALILALAGAAYAGIYVDFDSRESIKSAAALKAQDVMSFYRGQEPGYILGVLSGSGPAHHDYLWWQAGAPWGTVVDYWKYTGDTTYNVAVLLHGASFMYDFSGNPELAGLVDGLLDSMLRTFFIPPVGDGDGDTTIAWEPTCEGGISNAPADGCTGDMLAFKGFGVRWMATTAQLCPRTRDRILPVQRASAEAAVQQCVGGSNRRMCGMKWALGLYDKSVGVGQEMNVLSALMVLLGHEPTVAYGEVGDLHRHDYAAGQLPHARPLTHDTGGTSEGDPGAGEGVTSSEYESITVMDVAAAAILTCAVIIFMFAVFVFIKASGQQFTEKTVTLYSVATKLLAWMARAQGQGRLEAAGRT